MQPILVESKEGLGLHVPPHSFTVADVEKYVGKLLFEKSLFVYLISIHLFQCCHKVTFLYIIKVNIHDNE